MDPNDIAPVVQYPILWAFALGMVLSSIIVFAVYHYTFRKRCLCGKRHIIRHPNMNAEEFMRIYCCQEKLSGFERRKWWWQ